MSSDDLRELEDHATWLDQKGAAATDAYERGRYFGKAEGIRLVADLLNDDAVVGVVSSRTPT